jgi:hypothetical protein
MHQRGLAHMDIRPANMFLASTGHVVDHKLRPKSVNLSISSIDLAKMLVQGYCC